MLIGANKLLESLLAISSAFALFCRNCNFVQFTSTPFSSTDFCIFEDALSFETIGSVDAGDFFMATWPLLGFSFVAVTITITVTVDGGGSGGGGDVRTDAKFGCDFGGFTVFSKPGN